MVGEAEGNTHQGHKMKIRTKKASVRVEVEGVTFLVSQITLPEVNGIKAKHTTTDRGGGKETDIDKLGRDLFSLRVREWEGELIDEDGKQLDCNKENKALLWEYDNEYAGQIMEAANSALAAREDIDAKNL